MNLTSLPFTLLCNTFIIIFIKQTEITKLSFDINRSYKSPVNIDLTGINPDTPEGKLFLCIYDKWHLPFPHHFLKVALRKMCLNLTAIGKRLKHPG